MMPTKYSGAEWLASAKGIKLSRIGTEAAETMGQVFRGLYHIAGKDLDASVWTDEAFCEVRLGWCDLPTFDNARLTELVILCHDRCVRLDISAKARGYLTLLFHLRQREGKISERHPTMEGAIESVRKAIGLAKGGEL